MVSPVLAQAILGQGRAPDLVGQFFQGQEEGRRAQSRRLAGEFLQDQLGTGRLGQLALRDPQGAAQLAQSLGIPLNETERLQSFARDVNIAKGLADIDPQQAVQFIRNARDNRASQGIPTPRMDEFLRTIETNPDAARQQLEALNRSFIQVGLVQGQAPGAQLKSFAPVTLVNKKTGEKRLAIPTIDPNTGRATFRDVESSSDFEVSKETAEEKRQADALAAREKAGAREQGKDIEKRRSGSIERGVDAARTLPTLRRARQILTLVRTGGINQASLAAKRFFGVESADEAELANLLGVQVLQQLKPTFGAQFTEREGARLESILASFGKSNEGNIRLVENAVRIAERAARQGLKSAREIDDQATVDEITDSLEFDISPVQQTQQPAQAGLGVGQSATVGGFTIQRIE